MEINKKKYLLLVIILVIAGSIFWYARTKTTQPAIVSESPTPLVDSLATPTPSATNLSTPTSTTIPSPSPKITPPPITIRYGTSTPPSVTLKVNGSHIPEAVSYNSTNTISWKTTGNIFGCVPGGYYVPLADASSTLWSRQGQMQPSGAEEFIAKMLSGTPPATGYKYFSPLELNITCTGYSVDGATVTVKDAISIPVNE
ncbi:MAG: hypothetical protein PHV93_00925 [Candidatus Pacebacteria bacterium]|nr:hypothetical protein [Candidatus Paceibacterota bacterium]